MTNPKTVKPHNDTRFENLSSHDQSLVVRLAIGKARCYSNIGQCERVIAFNPDVLPDGHNY